MTTVNFDTLIVVMLENRSFDHLLGYLSLPPFNRADVDGLRDHHDWVAEYATNIYNGSSFTPFHLVGMHLIDPPHERDDIAIQLGKPVNGVYPMNGFVEAYARNREVTEKGVPLNTVMGYYTPLEVPVSHFFAEEFTICDKWFSPLPAGTQPNRLMALNGRTLIDRNVKIELPSQPIVYDWLLKHSVRWRVYNCGISFACLMRSWRHLWDPIDGRYFRWFKRFADDVKNESAKTFPEVIFIEPQYTDAPVKQMSPNDDHPPTSIAKGQEFLLDIYNALTANPDRWSRTVLIVTYDEHGGFFDHVSPIAVPHHPAGARYNKFETTGVRVPAFIVSPLVKRGGVYSKPLDHTSILRLIGERFGNGAGYSPEVGQRADIGSVGDVLQSETRIDIPAPPPASNYFPDTMTSNSAAFGFAQEAMRREKKRTDG